MGGLINMLDGLRIRTLRMNKGYTTHDISNLSKELIIPISESYLEGLERDSKNNPSFRIV